MADADRLPFRPGHLTVNGQQMLRAIVTGQPEGEADHLGWHLDIESPPPDSDRPFLVIADMHVIRKATLIGTTFASFVVLPPRVKMSDVPVDPLRDAIARLHGESLWDSCALIVRQLAAMAALPGVDVPSQPPHSGTSAEDDAFNGIDTPAEQ